MKNKVMIKNICGCLLVILVFTVLFIGKYNNLKKVYAETVFENTLDSEINKIEQILDVECEELKLCEDLSTNYNLIYEDDDNNLYNVEEDEVVGYYNREVNTDENLQLTKAQIKKLADEYLKQITEEDDYKLYNDAFNEYTETYRFYYYYYIGGYKTSDRVYIEIDNGGNIVSFSNKDSGKFKDVKINLKSVDEIMLKAINKCEYKSDDFDISVSDIIITYNEEGKLNYEISLVCREIEGEDIYTDIVNLGMEE